MHVKNSESIYRLPSPQRKRRPRLRYWGTTLFGCFALAQFSACANLPFVEQNRAYSRIFVTDFATAWSASLEAITGANDVIQNRDLGTIQTGWIRNTDTRNFFEAFGPEDYYRRARYRLYLYVREGKKNQKRAVVVRIQKEQQVEKSPFSGWETIESDGQDEAVYLYRVGRVIAMQTFADRLDELKSKNFELEL